MTIASGFLQNYPSMNLPSGICGFVNNDCFIFAIPEDCPGFLQNPSGIDIGSGNFGSGNFSCGGLILCKGAESGVGAIGGCISGFQELMPSGNMIVGGFLEGIHGTNSSMVGGITSTTARGSGASEVGGAMYVSATPFGNKFIGGYMFGDAPFDYKLMGGYLQAAQIIPQSGGVGGLSYGLRGINNVALGGFAIGTWNRPTESIVDNLSRVLIKGNDDIVIDQSFSANSRYVLYKSVVDNFDAEVTVLQSDKKEFDTTVEVRKYHRNPSITITDVAIVGSYPWTVTIEASGHSYNADNEIITSGIDEMDFIWSDGTVEELSGSGMIYSHTHIFANSGLYKPIVMGYDKNRRAGSDFTELNFATGLDVPYISLSGLPRSGVNPLTVDFTVVTSGTLGAYNIFWDFGNGLSFYENADSLTMQYPMPGDYTPHVRIIDSRNIMIVDTLKVGFNR